MEDIVVHILLRSFTPTRNFSIKLILLLMKRNDVVLEQMPLALVEYADIVRKHVNWTDMIEYSFLQISAPAIQQKAWFD